MSRDPLPMSRLPIPTVRDRAVLHDGFVHFEMVTLDGLVHGRPAELKREVHDHGNGVAVLAFDPGRRTAVLVRQVRVAALMAGTDGLLIEAAAGIVDPGEDPADTARREAMEEAGLTLADLVYIGCPFSSPGAVTERVHLFLAEIDHGHARGNGGGVAHEHEELEVLELPLATLAAMADAGEILDMKTHLLVETLRRRRPELF
ncbi:MAG TPA: NUDIX domain-containing protein [Methylomirabilota bacterium]|nr:NUDIX domain-containing protein [Methylomirabilota bacterium]